MISIAFLALILTVVIQSVLLQRMKARAAVMANMLEAEMARYRAAQAQAALQAAEAAYLRARAQREQARVKPDRSLPKP
jgi:hypothetical protein